jgi:hypothetical protein
VAALGEDIYLSLLERQLKDSEEQKIIIAQALELFLQPDVADFAEISDTALKEISQTVEEAVVLLKARQPQNIQAAKTLIQGILQKYFFHLGMTPSAGGETILQQLRVIVNLLQGKRSQTANAVKISNQLIRQIRQILADRSALAAQAGKGTAAAAAKTAAYSSFALVNLNSLWQGVDWQVFFSGCLAWPYLAMLVAAGLLIVWLGWRVWQFTQQRKNLRKLKAREGEFLPGKFKVSVREARIGKLLAGEFFREIFDSEVTGQTITGETRIGKLKVIPPRGTGAKYKMWFIQAYKGTIYCSLTDSGEEEGGRGPRQKPTPAKPVPVRVVRRPPSVLPQDTGGGLKLPPGLTSSINLQRDGLIRLLWKKLKEFRLPSVAGGAERFAAAAVHYLLRIYGALKRVISWDLKKTFIKFLRIDLECIVVSSYTTMAAEGVEGFSAPLAMMRSSVRDPGMVSFWDIVVRAPIKEELERFGIRPGKGQGAAHWGPVVSADEFVAGHGEVYDIAFAQWRKPTPEEKIKLLFLSYDVEICGMISLAIGAVILCLPFLLLEICSRLIERFFPIASRKAFRQERRDSWLKALRISSVILPILWHSLWNFLAWLFCSVPASAPDTLAPDKGPSRPVIYIEDPEEVVAALVRNILRREGYQVLASLEEGCPTAPQLAILNPEVAQDKARLLRARFPGIRILIISGSELSEREVYDFGGDNYLYKPFNSK